MKNKGVMNNKEILVQQGKFNHIAADISKYRLVLGNTYCYRLLIRISQDVYNQESGSVLEYSVKDLIKSLNLESSSSTEARRRLKSTFTNMKKPIGVSTEYINSRGEEDIDWVEDQLIYKDEKKGDKIYLTISDTCVRLINGIGGFTYISPEILNKLESDQQSYLYLLLKSYARHNKHKRIFELNEFLIVMSADTQKCYDKSQDSNYISNIKRRLLGINAKGEYTKDKDGKPYGALYRINTFTDINVSVRFEKNPKTIYNIIFEIKDKENTNKNSSEVVQLSSESKLFDSMIKMIEDTINPELFKKYIKGLSFGSIDKSKNIVFFNVPSVQYIKELEDNIMIFKFYQMAFSHTFFKMYPGINLNYLIKPVQTKK